jgi:protein-arginine kinase activator protein McsA
MRALQNKRTYKFHSIAKQNKLGGLSSIMAGLSKFKPTIQTRTRNKTSHPGQVVNDAKQKRRTHDEMEKIRAEESRMQQEKDLEQAENIQKAADVEDRMRREDIDRRSSNRQATGLAPFRPPSTDVLGAEKKGPSDLNPLVRRIAH